MLGLHKNIKILIFLLSSFPFLHSMELVPLLEKKTEQRDEAIYETKRALVRYVSPKLMLLRHAEPMVSDVWREIYTKMTDLIFEGDKEFEEIFYSKPAIEAFQLYRSIKKTVGDKPIAPLYKMEQEKRDEILSKIAPWHGSLFHPVMSIKDQQQIHEFDDNVQQYFVGKDVRVLSVGEMNAYRLTPFIGGVGMAGSCGVASLLWSIHCCALGTKKACSSAVLVPVLGSSLGTGCIFCLVGLGCASYYCNQANKVTL
jgi:hypothetical protein